MISFINFTILQLSPEHMPHGHQSMPLHYDSHTKLHKTLSEYLSPDHTRIQAIPVWWKSGLASQATHTNQNWTKLNIAIFFNLAYKLALGERSPTVGSFIDHNFWYMYVFHYYLGLSWRYVTITNFLSKQDTAKFSKVGTVSHTSGITSNQQVTPCVWQNL